MMMLAPVGYGRDRSGAARTVTGMVLAATLAGLLAVGCAGPGTPVVDEQVVAIDADSAWAAVRTAQADRLDAMAVFSSAGDATIRFTDADGRRRTEQVDLRLWRVAPTQAAVRLSKVGNAFLLAGWNDDRWWLLDETGDRPVLGIHGFDAAGEGDGVAALLSPPTLLAMLGLMAWPASPPASLRGIDLDADGRPDGFEFELDRLDWVEDGTEAGAEAGAEDGGAAIVLPGRMVVRVLRPSDGPVGVELQDAAGRVVLASRLERFEPVETRGRPPGAWPSVSHRMRATRSNGDEIVVRLDGPLAGGKVSRRLFDLEAIRARVPDAIIEDMVPATVPGESGEER